MTCPYCGSDDIIEEYSNDGNYVSFHCLDCDNSWEVTRENPNEGYEDQE